LLLPIISQVSDIILPFDLQGR